MERNEHLEQCTVAQEQLVRDHIPLVHHVVNDVRARIPKHVPAADLESAAMFALYQAARTFDPERGVPFDAWARQVVVGYYFEERPMLELAEELGVTDSRISQMRAEAVSLLRDGLLSQLEPTQVSADALPDGRAARRKAAYYAEVAASSDYKTRLSSDAPTVHERLAAKDAITA